MGTIVGGQPTQCSGDTTRVYTSTGQVGEEVATSRGLMLMYALAVSHGIWRINSMMVSCQLSRGENMGLLATRLASGSELCLTSVKTGWYTTSEVRQVKGGRTVAHTVLSTDDREQGRERGTRDRRTVSHLPSIWCCCTRKRHDETRREDRIAHGRGCRHGVSMVGACVLILHTGSRAPIQGQRRNMTDRAVRLHSMLVIGSSQCGRDTFSRGVARRRGTGNRGGDNSSCCMACRDIVTRVVEVLGVVIACRCVHVRVGF